MMTYLRLLIVLLAIYGATSMLLLGQKNRDPDDEIYSGLVTLTGTVTIENHPILGVTPGTTTFVVFQSSTGSSCAVGTWTNSDGRYELQLSPGRYKLIIRAKMDSVKRVDILDPKQERFIDVGPAGSTTKFDIKIRLPGMKS